ncbi:hypothetical protein PMAYCL1PPCAC_19311, partial [Pristionchus mayeri]
IDAEFRIGLVDHSSCVEEKNGYSLVYSYYCDENCDMETGMGELLNCIMIGEESKNEKNEEEDLDRSRLVLSIIMPILFFFIIVIVVACGFCFLFK